MSEEYPPLDKPSARSWVFFRLSGIFLGLMILGFAFFIAHRFFDVQDALPITISILFVLPYCLGAIAAFFVTPDGRKPAYYVVLVPSALVIGTLILGGLFFREGWICLAMAAPLWWISAILGAVTVRLLHKRYRENVVLNSSVLVALPFVILAAEHSVPMETVDYEVSHAIVIDAPPEHIWPHLLDTTDISASEGRWNVTQDVLAVPRPVSAVVVGSGVGAIRYARWDKDISFEEHITVWEPGRRLVWNFQFPNDSVRQHTDRHIAPDGKQVQIGEGGYTLSPQADGRTKLTLHTTYRVMTPVNTYGSIWADMLLGDIHANILQIVKSRSEAVGGGDD